MSNYGFRAGKAKVKKLTVVNKMPVEFVIASTSVIATGALVSDWNTRTSTAAKVNKNLLVQMPYPMKVGICAGVAGTAGGGDKIRIVGYKANGEIVQEDVAVQATAAGVNYSNNAFAKIVSFKPYPAIPVPKSTKVGIGYRPVTVGLPYYLATSADLMGVSYIGVVATTAPSVSIPYQTLTLATTATGKKVSIRYLSKMQ
jgi:hypothetical protein